MNNLLSYIHGKKPINVLTGGTIMDALQTVFDTIMKVIEMIKDFLKQLGIMKDEEVTE